MPDSEEREFIREKIVDKAATPRHRVKKIVKMLAMAVVFGLVASLFFVLGMKFLQPRFLPEETKESESIHMGRDEQTGSELDPDASLGDILEEPPTTEEASGGQPESGEVSTNDMTVEETTEEGAEDTTLDAQSALQQQIDEAASRAALEALKQQEEYLALGWYRQVDAAVKKIRTGLVTVNSVTQDTDWFNNPISNADQSAGAIIYTTEAEVLILADYESIREAQTLTVTFFDGRTMEARIKKADRITGIAIVGVSKGALPALLLNSITTLTLGNSFQMRSAQPVLAAGCPAGYTGSVMMGMLALEQSNTVGTDTAFQLLYPDVRIAETGTGFLFDLNGELVGVLTRRYGEKDTGLPTAIGISSLKGILENLSSGIDPAYLGIQGQTVTVDIAAAYNMPTGIYVTRVEVDSPAYLAGLKAGDVITAAETTELPTMYKLQSFLENYSTGDVIRIKASRGGQEGYVEMDFTVTLGAR